MKEPLTWHDTREPLSNEVCKTEAETSDLIFCVEWLPRDDREIDPWEWSAFSQEGVKGFGRAPSLEAAKKLCEALA